MPIPQGIEGRVASLSDLMDTDVGVTIDEIVSNNRPVHVGEVSNVSDSTLTTVTTMPANGVKYITKILCSGFVSGKWDIYIDSVRKATMRTIDRNVWFDFNLPMKVLATEVVDVKVTHYDTGQVADFQATIFGYTVV